MSNFFSAIFMAIIALFPHSTPSSVQIATQSSTPAEQVIYSETQLTEIANTQNTTALPLGDGKYTTTTPQKGYIYLCSATTSGGGAQETGNWIQGSTWNLAAKPVVAGHISWPTAVFSNTISGTNRIISGNGLPVSTTTGIFPIASTDPAYAYDKNPNKIAAHSFTDTFPLHPTYSDSPYCMGGEVGIMLNGVPLFNGFDAELRDAAAHEVQDSCQGHPQVDSEYHYHSLSTCIPDIHETTVIGFALDGFPITGPEVSSGKYLTTNDLDACHGITSQIVLDGKTTTMYHYVMTEDFPYSVSCFRGKPVSMQVISGMNGQNMQTQGTNRPTGMQQHMLPPQQPPQEAITSCVGKSISTACSFTSPRGTVTGTCQTPPNQTSLLCVPNNPPQ